MSSEDSQELMEVDTEEPVPKPEVTILDLPDECLIKIFSGFSYNELIALQRTCKRFRSSTAYCLEEMKKIKIKIKWENNGNNYNIKIDNNPSWTSYSFEQLILLFADFRNNISSLTLCGQQSRVDQSEMMSVLYLANNHCGKNLKHLKLQAIKISVLQMDDFRDLFTFLHKLEINDALTECQLKKCLRFCRHLREFIILNNKYVELSDECVRNITALSMNCTAMKYTKWTELFQLKSLRHMKLILPYQAITDPNALVNGTEKPLVEIETLVLSVKQSVDAKLLLNAFKFKQLRKLVISFNSDYEFFNPRDENVFFGKNLENLVELHLIKFPPSFFTRYICPYLENMRKLRTMVLLSPGAHYFINGCMRTLQRIQESKATTLTIKFEDNSLCREFVQSYQNDVKNLKFEFIDSDSYKSKHIEESKPIRLYFKWK